MNKRKIEFMRDRNIRWYGTHHLCFVAKKLLEKKTVNFFFVIPFLSFSLCFFFVFYSSLRCLVLFSMRIVCIVIVVSSVWQQFISQRFLKNIFHCRKEKKRIEMPCVHKKNFCLEHSTRLFSFPFSFRSSFFYFVCLLLLKSNIRKML